MISNPDCFNEPEACHAYESFQNISNVNAAIHCKTQDMG